MQLYTEQQYFTHKLSCELWTDCCGLWIVWNVHADKTLMVDWALKIKYLFVQNFTEHPTNHFTADTLPTTCCTIIHIVLHTAVHETKVPTIVHTTLPTTCHTIINIVLRTAVHKTMVPTTLPSRCHTLIHMVLCTGIHRTTVLITVYTTFHTVLLYPMKDLTDLFDWPPSRRFVPFVSRKIRTDYVFVSSVVISGPRPASCRGDVGGREGAGNSGGEGVGAAERVEGLSGEASTTSSGPSPWG